MRATILIIDDHQSVRTMVADYLAEQDYHVVTAADGEEGLVVAKRTKPDLILLDIMMPKLDGLGFLQAFRRDNTAPVIMLTARVEETDKVVGLELGADDYLTKPFGMKELLARVRAHLRRVKLANLGPSTEELIRVGDLSLNRVTREVLVGDQPANLTPSEFGLLEAMMAAPGRVFSREQLLELLQGNAYEGVERTIDVHIRNLRRKIEADPTHPHYIETVFGAGYRCRHRPT
ncbi:response regulator transcription factor [Candidatus Chloroploca sp. Khr17]|uniref:response regulator transcription factor n=1 Tax=Candidatus Chloroploca sp. Khr17 TaxID=2496869 RepID=UPI00101B7770|nr:response regulator transcription factor [Candidatus Chloroploca sp. Khr17]